MPRFAAHILVTLAATLAASSQQPAPQNTPWPTYGNDPGGARFSPATQITPANLHNLAPAWTFHTHALDTEHLGTPEASFETTPILLGRALYFTSPFDVVFALDALTGTQLWSYDPPAFPLRGGMLVTSRGVAAWSSPTPSATPCNQRIFLGTIDARILALDAKTGAPCTDFGAAGTIDMRPGIDYKGIGGYSLTSPPTVLGNVLIVGSSVADNQQVDIESGLVRAYDVLTGKLLWTYEPLPWAKSVTPRSGAGNVWSIISADPELGLVFLPTSSAAPDYFGGLRPGDNRDADSVVALDARTGHRVWAFQTVHHNIWDYDVPSEPLLFTFKGSDGKATTPAIAITTKLGQVFVLDRRTGAPLFPITEQPAPASRVETASATQPISSLPPLSPLLFPGVDDGPWHRSPADAASCKQQLDKLRYQGLYTPPGTDSSLLFPSNVGGVNWGGATFDPTTGNLIANVNREVFAIRLVPRNGFYMWWRANEPDIRDWPLWVILGGSILLLGFLWRLEHNRLGHSPKRYLPVWPVTALAMAVAAVAAPMCLFPMPPETAHFGHELSPQRGTPYLILRDPVVDTLGHPCVAPPWGSTVALNLNTGTIAWQTPLGTLIPNQHTGSPIFGGPISTASGLIFTAATDDAQLRALDAHTGTELWSAPLPASARATPMTFTLDGKQFIVIAAGGHGGITGKRGDSLVAFSLATP